MTTAYKPQGYNSLSPYFIVNDAQRLIDLLKRLFNAEELRRYDKSDGTILHAEVKIDDTVLMIGNSSTEFPANQLLIHVYVSDVDATFEKALALGCTAIEKPKQQEGDPDRRGSFRDFAGNVWAIGTQLET